MTKVEANEKAKENVKAVNGDPNAYQIPYERAETARSKVGKSFTTSKGTITITDWIGQNYVIEFNGDYSVVPVVYFLSKVLPVIKEVK
jgi:hypothetical protein